MTNTPRVAIVGAGCSGTLTAIHLLAGPAAPSGGPQIVMFERTPHVGPGLAYRWTSDRHLLNVPAADMSAFPDDQDHFLRWLGQHHPGFDRNAFVPRGLYGDYLKAALDKARSGVDAARDLHLVRAQVTDLTEASGGRLMLRCADRRTVACDQVVLALGNFPPRRPAAVGPAVAASDRYLSDPWAGDGVTKIPIDASVLLLGSGLTAVDITLALAAQGHRGPLHAVSRHGLYPHAHRVSATAPVVAESTVECARNARDLLHAIRTQAQAVQSTGGDWRAVVDGLRPSSNRLWAQLPPAEQRRVLRHLRSYWNVHRHRVAPAAAAGLDGLRASGQLTVTAGRLDGCVPAAAGLRVSIRSRAPGAGGPQLGVIGYLINCTGPDGDVAGTGDRLLESLLARGWARPGPHGVGLAIGADGAVRDHSGHAGGRLWALGSLRQGTTWETTAVPEIRRQAAEVAALVSQAIESKQGEAPDRLGNYREAV